MYLAKDVIFVLREMASAGARWDEKEMAEGRWLPKQGCQSQLGRWGMLEGISIQSPKGCGEISLVPFPVGGGAWAAG